MKQGQAKAIAGDPVGTWVVEAIATLHLQSNICLSHEHSSQSQSRWAITKPTGVEFDSQEAGPGRLVQACLASHSFRLLVLLVLGTYCQVKSNW